MSENLFQAKSSALDEVKADCSPEGLIRKLTARNFGHIIQGQNYWKKISMLGRIKGNWRTGQLHLINTSRSLQELKEPMSEISLSESCQESE